MGAGVIILVVGILWLYALYSYMAHGDKWMYPGSSVYATLGIVFAILGAILAAVGFVMKRK